MRSAVASTLIVLIVLTAGTVAYACGGGGGKCSTTTIFAGGQQGGGSNCKPDIIWENPSSITASISTVSCKYTLTSTLITVLITNLAPGESCTLKAILANIGNAQATLTESVSIAQPSACHYYAYSDNIPASPARVLGVGGTLGVQALISLGAAGGNKCQHTTATISVTVDGTG